MAKRRHPLEHRATNVASFAETALDNLPDNGAGSIFSENTLDKRDGFVGAFSAAASANWRMSMQQQPHSSAESADSPAQPNARHSIYSKSLDRRSRVSGNSSASFHSGNRESSGEAPGIFDFYTNADSGSESEPDHEVAHGGRRRSASPLAK